jgi:hypothetical protein
VTTLPVPPLNPHRFGALLTACGFTRHLIPDYPGGFGGPAIVHLARPGHTVALTEYTDPGDRVPRVFTELAVYPADAPNGIALSGGPVSRLHAMAFEATFGPNVPPVVIQAAAVAALTARPVPRCCATG